MDAFTYFNPVRLHFGTGQLGNLGRIAVAFGKKVLLVTHPWHDAEGTFVPQATNFERAKQFMKNAGMTVLVYDNVQPNPDVVDIDEGAKLTQENDIDLVVGMGGGSAMDTAKAIAVTAKAGCSAWDLVFFKKPKISETILPIITITTTSGTGSHMTNIAVVSNRETNEKFPIVHSRLYPVLAICDPELMVGIPRRITIETGFDVFAHALESYTARKANPLIDELAFETMRRVSEALVPLSRDLGNIELRKSMAFADTLAGICISNVGTTVPHAMGQPISAIAPSVSHGHSLMLVFPPFLTRIADAVPDKLVMIGKLFDENIVDPSDAVQAIIAWIHDFELPSRLKDIGIGPGDIDELHRQSLMFKKIDQGPGELTAEDVAAMYHEIL